MSLVLAPGQALYLTTGTPATNQALAMASFAVPGGAPNSALAVGTGTTPVMLAQAVYGSAPTVVSSLQVFNPDTGPLSIQLTVQSGSGTPVVVYENASVPANGEVCYEGSAGWQLLVAGIPTESPQFPAVSANRIYAGPASSGGGGGGGSTGLPSFRQMVNADLPSMAGSTLLGNATASSATPTAVPLGTGLAFSGGALTNTVSIPQDYISGLKMTWNSATSISVSSGAAYIPSLTACFASSATLTLSGLALAASTWYHIYLYSNAGTPAIECVTTAPAAPYFGTARAKTGDTSRRYLGSVRTDASGNLWFFQHAGNRVSWGWGGTGAPPQRVLSNGTATTATTVSFSGSVPVTATHANARFQNFDTSAPGRVANSLIPGAVGATGSGTYNFSYAVAPGTVDLADAPLDNSQAMLYWFGSPPTSNMSIDVFGYLYER